MKTYIVYIDGREEGYITARNHNRAERKAKSMFGGLGEIMVVCTEL